MINRIFRHPQAPLLAFVIVFLAAAVGFAHVVARINYNAARISKTQRTQTRLIHRQEEAIQGACHRLNVVRATDNHNNAVDYYFDIFTLRLLKTQTSINRNQHKRPTTNQASRTQQYTAQLHKVIDGKSWIPLTSCAKAVQHPNGFVPPNPIPFSKQRPTAAAFNVGKGE